MILFELILLGMMLQVEGDVSVSPGTEGQQDQQAVQRPGLGSTPTQVIKTLGQPSLDRSDARARHLQFIQGKCILDFYFYATQKEDKHLATYLEARSHQGQAMPTAQCIDQQFTLRHPTPPIPETVVKPDTIHVIEQPTQIKPQVNTRISDEQEKPVLDEEASS